MDLGNFIRQLSQTFYIENKRVNSKNLLLNSILWPIFAVLSLVIVGLDAEICNMFGGGYFACFTKIYILLFQPILIIYLCYELNNKSICYTEPKYHKSNVQKYLLEYSKTLLIFKYNIISILTLLLCLCINLEYSRIATDIQVFYAYLDLNISLIVVILSAILSLPFLTMIFTLTLKSNNLFSYLFILSLIYIINFNTTISSIEMNIYHIFNFQIVPVKMLSVLFNLNFLEFTLMISINFILMFLILYYIKIRSS